MTAKAAEIGPFFCLTERNKMGKYFVRGTPLAELERQMMMVPNFAPRGSGSAVLCHYRPTAADVDCRNCLQYRRRSCRSLNCPYISERLEAGAVAMDELIAETVRPWKHLPLKQRAAGLACREERFRFEGQLHVMRMEEMTKVEAEYVNMLSETYEENPTRYILLRNGNYEISYEGRAITLEEREQLLDLYDRSTGLFGLEDSIINIVTEQAGAYFAGDRSLDDTVAAIQSRVGLYLAELQ